MTEEPRPTPEPVPGTTEAPAERPAGKDPLRRSRTSQAWVAVTSFAVVLILLIIFIAQNTQRVQVSFLGWDGHTPLAVALLLAAAGAMVVTAVAGAMRILQLRRRVGREKRRHR
jgi:uncharacterized integral membrane protein